MSRVAPAMFIHMDIRQDITDMFRVTALAMGIRPIPIIVTILIIVDIAHIAITVGAAAMVVMEVVTGVAAIAVAIGVVVTGVVDMAEADIIEEVEEGVDSDFSVCKHMILKQWV
jgi:hypothetical protein